MRSPDPFPGPQLREVLESWKEIAAYLGRSVRTVQSWEKEEDLPIHRHQHDKQGSVFAYREELDRWRESRTAAPAPPQPHLVFPEPAAPEVGFPWARRLTALAIAAAVIATIAGLVLRPGGPAGKPARVESIAVLPIRTSEAGRAVDGDGLTELLIDELARLPGLRVMARSSVSHYQGRLVRPVEVARELGVDAVLNGEVSRSTSGYDARLELVNARDGSLIWTRRYESAPAALAFVHGRMADDLARALRGRSSSRALSSNPVAYEQYLLGLRAFHQRSLRPATRKLQMESAVAHFKESIRLDPSFAAAYAGLANAQGTWILPNMIDPAEGAVLVLENAGKALELDPANAQAYAIVASLKSRVLWDFAGAERDFLRAIDLDPSAATSHQWYAAHLYSMGRYADARREVDLAYQLDPLSPAVTAERCWGFYCERRFREAIAFGREVEARDPDRTPWQCMNGSLLALGEYEPFLANLDRIAAPRAKEMRTAFARRGARGIFETQQKNASAGPTMQAIRVLALLGEKDEAFAALDAAVAKRHPIMSEYHLEPAFDPLRDDPRFAAIAKRMGLPQSALEAASALAKQTPYHPLSQ